MHHTQATVLSRPIQCVAVLYKGSGAVSIGAAPFLEQTDGCESRQRLSQPVVDEMADGKELVKHRISRVV